MDVDKIITAVVGAVIGFIGTVVLNLFGFFRRVDRADVATDYRINSLQRDYEEVTHDMLEMRKTSGICRTDRQGKEDKIIDKLDKIAESVNNINIRLGRMEERLDILWHERG